MSAVIDAHVARLAQVASVPSLSEFVESVPPQLRGELASHLARACADAPSVKTAAAVAALVRIQCAFDFDGVLHGDFLRGLVDAIVAAGPDPDPDAEQFVSALNNCVLGGGAGDFFVQHGLVCRLVQQTLTAAPRLRLSAFAFLHRLACRCPEVARHVSSDAACPLCFHALAEHATLGFDDGGMELLKLLFAAFLSGEGGGAATSAAGSAATDWAVLASFVHRCLHQSATSAGVSMLPAEDTAPSHATKLRLFAAQALAVWPPAHLVSFPDPRGLGMGLAEAVVGALGAAVGVGTGELPASPHPLGLSPPTDHLANATLLLGALQALAEAMAPTPMGSAALAGASEVFFGGAVPKLQALGGAPSPLLPGSVRAVLEPDAVPQLRVATEAAALALCRGDVGILSRAVGIAPAAAHVLRQSGGLE